MDVESCHGCIHVWLTMSAWIEVKNHAILGNLIVTMHIMIASIIQVVKSYPRLSVK